MSARTEAALLKAAATQIRAKRHDVDFWDILAEIPELWDALDTLYTAAARAADPGILDPDDVHARIEQLRAEMGEAYGLQVFPLLEDADQRRQASIEAAFTLGLTIGKALA